MTDPAHALSLIEWLAHSGIHAQHYLGTPNRPDVDQHDPMIGSHAASTTVVRYAGRHDPNGAAWLHLAVDALAHVSQELLYARIVTDPPSPIQTEAGHFVPRPELIEPRLPFPAPRDAILKTIAVLAAWLHDIDSRGDGRIRWPDPSVPRFTRPKEPLIRPNADDVAALQMIDAIGRATSKPTR